MLSFAINILPFALSITFMGVEGVLLSDINSILEGMYGFDGGVTFIVFCFFDQAVKFSSGILFNKYCNKRINNE